MTTGLGKTYQRGEISAAIKQPIHAIATQAAMLRVLHGPKGRGDHLENWSVQTDFGTYTITVSCQYRPKSNC